MSISQVIDVLSDTWPNLKIRCLILIIRRRSRSRLIKQLMLSMYVMILSLSFQWVGKLLRVPFLMGSKQLRFFDLSAELHYGDAIMGAITSQITSLTIVYSTVYSDADQRKYQSSASLAFVRGIHRGPVNSPHKWPVTREMFPFDDVIMTYQLCMVCVHSGSKVIGFSLAIHLCAPRSQSQMHLHWQCTFYNALQHMPMLKADFCPPID